jgi:hypothetical protein
MFLEGLENEGAAREHGNVIRMQRSGAAATAKNIGK